MKAFDQKVLIVDDDEGICKSLSVILKNGGYQVATVSTGKAAIEKVEQEKETLNLAIIDIKLPDISGVKVLRKIKEINPGITCIVITAYPTLAKEDELLREGAARYFIKPIPIEKLLEFFKGERKG